MTEQVIKPHFPNDVPKMENVDICGLSARFPESSSGSEFYQNLVSGLDMVNDEERKWKHFMHPRIPQRAGKMKKNELYCFDAQFFGIHGQQAKKMDPQIFKLLETSYEAWVDSGIDVRALRDSNRVGVYTGICGSEVHGWYIRHQHNVTGYEQTGCVMSMTANRLSYFYSFRGPSKTCDTACSSAAMSLHDAIADISAGRIDYAVVLGSCHVQAPNMTLAFNNLHMLSPEGACKAFDAAGNGYVRSEGVAAIVLQRTDLADVPRWAAVSPYCTIHNIGINNDGFTKEGLTFPSRHAQLALEQQVCNAAKVNPADVVYVEAHGTGTVAGDGQELDAIDRFYGRAENRAAPLLIGSVKSNMGHCEGCSCLAGIIKVCLALEYGVMPGNLHYHKDTPNPDSEGLRDGTLEVVDTTRPFEGGYMALSSFGFGGANMHMVFSAKGGQRINLLQSDSSSSDGSVSEEAQPEIVTPLAARSSEGLAYLANIVNEAEAADGTSFSEPLRRYANSVVSDMKLAHRGILVNGELKAGAAVHSNPEVWYVFSGNGSQWPKMALSLLNSNPTFRKAISACAAVVKPLGIDLIAEFQAEKGWKTPVLASVGLIAVQIGLVDILREEYGIVPDGMLGHSAGEIGCTYASGCCTKEQAMLIAYHRGRLPVEHGINTGLMAATGLSAEQAIERCQGTGVVMACDNSPTSTTLSGPAEEVRELVKQLESENIFARALDTNGVPYHSAVLQPLLPELDRCLKEVMPNPLQRPAGWVSAAFEPNSELADAALCSAGYQVHSYRNPVLFTGAAKQIPKDALLVEIGPHSILRSPLRQSRPDLGYVNVMKKGEDGMQSLTNAIGDMWRKGVAVQWKADGVPETHAGAEVPRSIREALTSWDRVLYDIPIILASDLEPGHLHLREYDLGGKDHFIVDHCIDGNVFIPLACFLVTAWEVFAMFEEKEIWDYPVEFLDVAVFQPVRVEKTDKVVLGTLIDFKGKFQIIYEGELICSGTLKKYDVEARLAKEPIPDDCLKHRPKPPKEITGIDPNTYDHMTMQHWYANCERQNLQYGPMFRTVNKYGVDRTWAELKWNGNWICHLDGLLQTTDRRGDYDVHVAKGMRRLVIIDTLKGVEEGYLDRVGTDTNWRLSRSRSMILQNFQDEITHSKHKPVKTIVHKLDWRPYGERTVEDAAKTTYAEKLTSFIQQLLEKSTSDDRLLQKVKSLFKGASGKSLTAADAEELTSAESNRLAKIFSDLLSNPPAPEEGAEEAPPKKFQNAITQHSALGKAQAEDPFLTAFTQHEIEPILLIAISNMKASGYTVGQFGAENAAFTRKAVETFITVPQSSLLSYTAIGKSPTSDVTKAVPHSSVAYKAWDINSPKGSSAGPFNILVASHLSGTASHLPTALSQMFEATTEGGFVLLEEFTSTLGAAVYGFEDSAWNRTDGRKFGMCTSVAHWKQLLSGAGFKEVVVARRPGDVSTLFLYRKAPAPAKAIPLEGPRAEATEEEMDEWLKTYLDTLNQADPAIEEDAAEPGIPSTVWLYGDAVNHPGLRGFFASARKEYKGDRIRVVISSKPGVDYKKLIESARPLDLQTNYFEGQRNGVHAPVQTKYSHTKEESSTKNGAHLNFDVYGKLSSWVWRENIPIPDGIAGIIKCDVAFGALNFRDVMLAYGKLSKQQMAHESGGDNIGFEFSGVIAGTKTRVMGSAKNALATKIVTRKDLTWVVPDSWSLAEAATVPTAYMTAYYAMVMRGRVRKDMRVLIHSGTGAVGMAAIQICLNRGAEVFTTCGSASKRKFLLETFPGLADDHIGDSRSESFEGLVRNKTRGKGVHLLLNSLSDEKLQASVRCLGNWGKLLEIGKYDILQGTPLSMRPMLNNIAFEGIDVDRVMNHPASTELAELNALVAAGIASGEVKPLPVTVFPRTEVEEAFRYLASGVHIGKVMIDVTASPRPQHTNNCLGGKKAPAPQNGQQEAITLPPLKMQPTLYFRPDRSYIITGGLGGFGISMFEMLCEYGANNIVLTSKRGVTNGNQQIILQTLYTKKKNFRVTTLDVGVPEEAEQIVKLAESLAPLGGVFHLAMNLADKLITNQSGESWQKAIHAKYRGGVNLDLATRNCKQLEHFAMWSSFVASAGNEGQTNYGYANSALDTLAEKRRALGLPAVSVQWGVIDHVGVADTGIQELMASGLLGAALPQPIDDCLKTMGQILVAGPYQAPVMSSSWQPLDLFGKSSSGEVKDVGQAILTVMGLSASEVNDSDTLSRLGIDSMQLVEARSTLQRALGRPVSLEEVASMTIGALKAMGGDDDGDDAGKVAPAADAAPAEATPVDPSKGAAPIIHPAKLVDLEHDLPFQLPTPPALIKVKDVVSTNGMNGEKKGIKPNVSTSSLNAPPTPTKSPLLRPSHLSTESINLESAGQSRSTSPEAVPVTKPKLAAPVLAKPPAARKLGATPTPGTAAAVAPTAAAATGSVEEGFSWAQATRAGVLLIVTSILLVMGWGLRAAAALVAQYGMLATLPLLPVIYLLAGGALALVTILVKNVLLPKTKLDEPIKLFSTDFFRWWLITRLMDLTNLLVMKHFRGTVILNYYYSLLGAQVADSAFIDTVDLMDVDCLEIGKDAVIGEGNLVTAHTFKNGTITFSKVVIGTGVNIQPFGIVTPQTQLKEGQVLTPNAKSSSKSTLASAPGLAVAFSNEISGSELTPSNHTAAQIGALLLPLLLASIAAYAGCLSFGKVLAALGITSKLPVYAYTAAAFVAMSNPTLLIFAAVAPAAQAVTLSGLASLVPAALASFIALPIGWGAYALTLVGLASFAKHFLTGRIEPGVHKRNTSYGVAFWASQRLMDLTYANVSSVFMGTWALNAIYRVFGASIGSYTTFRKVPAITVPDMVKMGKLVVNGDTCKIASCIAVDSTTIACAPLKIGDQATLGASSVLLPGTTLGTQSTLAPLAAPAIGSVVEAKSINLGAPAVPVKFVKRPEPVVDIQLPMHILAQMLPFLQAIFILTLALASHIPAAVCGLYLKSHNPGFLGSIFGTMLAVGIQTAILGALNTRAQHKSGNGQPGVKVRQWSLPYILTSGVTAASIYFLNLGAHIWMGTREWTNYLRRYRIDVGEGCYIDGEWTGEPNLTTFADGAVADRGSIIFGHLMTHNGEAFEINFGHVTVGPGAVVSARSGVFPGSSLKAGEVVPSGTMKMAAA